MEQLWWRCVWGHVFRAPAVPEGQELRCAGQDDAGVCGSYFLYTPFDSEEAARRGEVPSGPQKWAHWART